MPEEISAEMVEDTLLLFVQNPTATIEDLAERLRVRRTTAMYLYTICESRGLIVPRDTGKEVPEKLVEVLRQLKHRPFPSCQCCGGRTIEVDTKDFVDYDELLRRRIWPDRTIDQYQATPDTMFARVSYIVADHAVRNRRVLILGDGDFTSVGLALHGVPFERMVVLELHDGVLTALKSVVEETKLGIELRKFDLENPLPDELAGQFDTVFGDPPWTYKGIITWIQRGIEALVPGGGRMYLVCPFHPHDTRGRNLLATVSSFALSRGYSIISLIHGFNKYEGNDFQRASLIRIEQTTRYDKEEEVYWWNPADLKVNVPIIQGKVVEFVNAMVEQI